jgi:hypothetical protein
MTRHLLGLAAGALLTAGLGCVSDPTEALTDGIAGVRLSLNAIQVDVGDSTLITAETTDEQGNPLTILPEVATLDAAIATVTLADVPPLPQRRFYVKGVAFGTARVEVTAGDQSDTVYVQTWPATIGILGVNSQMRSRETATVGLTGLDALGDPVAGVTPITVVSGDATILAVDPATNVVTALDAGFATLTAYGPANADGDTVAVGTFGVRVVAAVPASVELSGTTFGGMAAAQSSTLELVVLDAYGNQNLDSSEVLSASVNSSNNGIATVAVAIEDTAANGTERHIFVTVTGVSAGAINVTGTVTTTQGALALGATPATVLAPQITSTALASGAGATVSITGIGLSAAGFTTVVLVDGTRLGNFTVVSANQIDARMPTFGTDGTFDVEVTVGGVASNTGAWTQSGGFDENEAANDAPGTAPTITVPFDFSGAFEGAPEEDDFFVFTITSAVTLVIDLGWNPAKDLDILVSTGGFSGFVCTNGATGARPEQATCTLNPGTYFLWLNDFDADANGNTTPVTYTVTGRIQ